MWAEKIRHTFFFAKNDNFLPKLAKCFDYEEKICLSKDKLSPAEHLWQNSWNFIDIKTLKMQCKTKKFEEMTLDEKEILKTHHGMLDHIKIYLPTNFHAFMMNICWKMTKKPIYDNMQMSFLAKIAIWLLIGFLVVSQPIFIMKAWKLVGRYILTWSNIP